MRILWFNWRDIRNPAAGGAEVFTHEVIRRLSKKGYQITLFASQYPGCAKKETIEDVDIIRDGGRYGVYKKSIEYYRMHREDYDLIIDEINTRPFLTPKFVTRQRIIALIHQLAREFWFYETPFPLNYLGYYYLENKWLSYYRNTPIITVSASSKKDLEELGFKKIFIVPEGLNVVPLANVPEKELQPTIIFTGRLKRVKLPHHAIKAFSIIKNEIPDARMWVVGDGYMLDELKKMNVEDVTFFGHVRDELKYKLMSKAHISIVPGVREGWGLVVTESNAMGTPAIAYNVRGLRDSVVDGKTGILVNGKSPESLAKTTVELFRDPEYLKKLSYNALQFSRNFNWNNSVEVFDKIIRDEI